MQEGFTVFCDYVLSFLSGKKMVAERPCFIRITSLLLERVFALVVKKKLKKWAKKKKKGRRRGIFNMNIYTSQLSQERESAFRQKTSLIKAESGIIPALC